MLQSDLQLVSHIVCEMVIDESSNILFGVMDVLDTPTGRIVDTLLRAGCKVGVSTRAEGSLEKKLDESGAEYYRVIPEDYKFKTVDFTADPSTLGMAPHSIRRNIIPQLKTAMSGAMSESERKFATSILESVTAVKNKFDGTIKDAIEKKLIALGTTVQVFENDELVSGSVTGFGDNSTVAIGIDNRSITVSPGADISISSSGIVSIYPSTEEIPMQKPDVSDIKVNPDDVSIPVEPVENAPEEDIKEEPEEAPEDIKEEPEEDEDKEDKMKESKTFSTNKLLSENIDLKIKCAELTVLVESVGEYIQTTVGTNAVNGALLDKLRRSLSDAQQNAAKYSETCKKLAERVEMLESQYDKEISALNTKVANLTEQNKQYKGKLVAQVNEHKANLTKVKSMLAEKYQRDLVSAYVDFKVDASGMPIHENARALLESCKSTKDVDRVFKDIRGVMLEGALHQQQPVQRAIIPKSDKDTLFSRKLKNVFEGF